MAGLDARVLGFRSLGVLGLCKFGGGALCGEFLVPGTVDDINPALP